MSNKNATTNKYLNNRIILFLMAILVLSTWLITRWLKESLEIEHVINIFKLPINTIQLVTIVFYIIVTIVLIVMKISPTYLIFFSVMSAASVYPAIYLSYFNRSYYLVYYFVVGIVAVYSIVIVAKQGFKFKYQLLPLMGILLVYNLISIIWGKNLMYGANFFAVMIQGYLIYLIVNNLEEKVKFYDVAWFLSLMLLIIGIQYLVLINGRVVGESSTINFIKDNSLFEYLKLMIKKQPGKLHLFPLWANANIVAGVVGLTFYPSLYKYFSKDKSPYVYLFLPFELIAVFSIFASLSSGLIFGFIFGTVMIVFALKYKNYKVSFGIFLGFIFSFLVFVVTVVLLQDKFPKVYEWLNEFSTHRFSIYTTAINRLKNPLTLIFGAGIGTSKDGATYFYYHSWIFNTLTNTGLIGFAITLLMIFKTFKMLLTSKEPFAIMFLMGALVYLSHGIFDVGYDYQYIGVAYYGIIALIEKNSLEQDLANNLEIKNSKTKIKVFKEI